MLDVRDLTSINIRSLPSVHNLSGSNKAAF
jgi:hypothetical protein